MWVPDTILQMVQQHVLHVQTSPQTRTIPARAVVQTHVAGHVMPDTINLGHRVCNVVRDTIAQQAVQVKQHVAGVNILPPDLMRPVIVKVSVRAAMAPVRHLPVQILVQRVSTQPVAHRLAATAQVEHMGQPRA